MPRKAQRGVKQSRAIRLQSVLFIIPFILAYFSWKWFPIFAEHCVLHLFGYTLQPHHVHWIWYLTVGFLYAWYTFFTVGLVGTFIVAAWIWKRRRSLTEKMKFYPMVSFVVPAYNEEKQISRCVTSLFRCAANYLGLCQIIVVDDGSTDLTYEIAWAILEQNRKRWPQIYGKVVRHSANLGKVEAIRTGVNDALGNVIAVVDADSWWEPNALCKLVSHMSVEEKSAVTGYVHPSDGGDERNPYVILQQLEYSQGLAVFRCAQVLGNAVLVVPGSIGVYEADVLREILNETKMRSVTEDFEITLEMQRRGLSVSYVNQARSGTIAPTSSKAFWNQRLRWFTGGLHNILNIHRKLLFKRRWLSLLLWYCIISGYVGAVIGLVAVFGIPFFFWFAPDRIFFVFNLLMYLPYSLIIGIIGQAVALKFAYHEYNHKQLLIYTPFYSILWFINILARFVSSIKCLFGDSGAWRKAERPFS
ncbi:MAG: glycosyltransferase family 2 protein [Thermoproteota archaeon]|nr:glycosyltransferase family 2 protein [Thermoproteota archaeon]